MTLTDTLVDRPVLNAPSRPTSGLRRGKDALATLLVTGAFATAAMTLVWVVYAVVVRGLPGLLSAEWWAYTAAALFNSIGQGLLAITLATPVGLLAALYLVEYGSGAPRRAVTFLVNVLAGVPAVVVALVVAAVWTAVFGIPDSDFVVALALAPVILPAVIRAGVETLRAVPDDVREAGLALGIPRWRFISRVVLPCACPGASATVLAALARAFGEAAPVVVVVGYGRSLGDSVGGAAVDDLASLPLVLLTALSDPARAGDVWATALALVLLVTVGHVSAVAIGRRAVESRERGR